MATAAGTTPKFVTTIDFGTTHCSVAYLIRPDLEPNPSEVEPTVLTLDNAGNKRAPSCILFDSSGNKIAFGHEARELYASYKQKLRPQFHYFEHVKKHLKHKTNIDRNRRVLAMNGNQFYLVDVIAHILHHLKDRLLTVLKDLNLTATDFDWVITVPAFWKSGGRKMMHEAGYMAGLCSDSEPPPIQIATGIRSTIQDENLPVKLSLVSEPEAAAIYCRRKARVAGKGTQYVVRAENYLVIDIGGGTVDIASHAMVDGRIKEIAPPVFSACGGTTVNDAFSKFLEDFVDDEGFERYTEESSPEIQARHKADLNKLLYTTFETQKKRFGSGEACDSYIVRFPSSFLKVYKESILEKALNLNEDMFVEVEDDGEVMRIYEKKMAEFFQPAIHGVTNLIQSYLHKNKIARTIDTVYWVGGFGGWEYLRNQLEKVIEKEFQGCSYQFALPPEPEFAVIRGAIAFRCDSGIFAKMKPDSQSDEDPQQLQKQQSTSSGQTASARETFHEEQLVHPQLYAQAPTPPNTNGEKPTNRTLTLLKWNDRGKVKKLRVVNEIVNQWRRIGNLLDIPRPTLDGWETQTNHNPEQCCDKVLGNWLQNPPDDYPATWNGLLELLGDAEYKELVETLKKALVNKV